MLNLSRRDLLISAAAAFAGFRLTQAPAINYNEGNYRFDETSEPWKVMCRALPCFAALHWPDYSTAVVEDRIDGHPVVIQLWKGFCPRFLSSANMPGGIGAEVGIYRRIPGKEWSRPAGFPADVYAALRAMAGSSELWWPYPELPTEVEWDLINPETKGVFIHAGRQTTYWRNKWMNNESYSRYQNATRTPKLAWNYSLRYTINGKTYPAW
ncbi:MAG TPA: hypothetical protein VFV78_15135 [Vicinamibacterales bacterium]|nr:hypothetical protein [Vicinamibacterales bacterium]